MRYFLRYILIFLCFIGELHANSTTTRAGHFWIEEVNINLYNLSAQILLSNVPINTDSALIQWGDGFDENISLFGQPMSISNGAFLISISGQHAYSPGNYNLYLHCGKRVPWIQNMASSDTTNFTLSATLTVSPSYVGNFSPRSDSLNLEAEMIISGSNTISMLVTDNNADSIQWNRVTPLGCSGYQYPEVIGSGTFSVYPYQNYYEWNPQAGGLYTVLFSFTEYRQISPGNWISLGTITREVLIDAGQVSGITSNSLNSSCLLYPNPVIDIITFTLLNEQQSHVLVIYDIYGKEVWREETNASSLTISFQEYAEGIYLYSIIAADGTSAQGKFVIQ